MYELSNIYSEVGYLAATFFVMTVERAVTDQYGTRTHLMDTKYLSPLIVSIVRDGALFYMLYVMCTLSSFVPMVVLLFDVARLFGVFINPIVK